MYSSNNKEVSNNFIMKLLNDSEVQAGGIFHQEKKYMEKYNLTEHESGMIQSMVYAIKHIDKIKDIKFEWKH